MKASEKLEFLKDNFEELKNPSEYGSWHELQIIVRGVNCCIDFVYSDGQIYYDFKGRDFDKVVSEAYNFLYKKLEEEKLKESYIESQNPECSNCGNGELNNFIYERTTASHLHNGSTEHYICQECGEEVTCLKIKGE